MFILYYVSWRLGIFSPWVNLVNSASSCKVLSVIDYLSICFYTMDLKPLHYHLSTSFYSMDLKAALLMISCFVLQLEHGFDLTVSRMRMKQQYLNNCPEINQRRT